MIEIKDDMLKKAEMLLGDIPGAVPKAASNAINRSLEAARTEAVRSVTKEYIITAKEVRNSMPIVKAKPTQLLGTIRSEGNLIPLSKFDISPKQPPSTKKTVMARVKKGSGRKSVAPAFLARMPGGGQHVGIYKRVGKSRLPLEEKYGPSLPQMLGAESVRDKIEKRAEEVLGDRFEHETNRILEGR